MINKTILLLFSLLLGNLALEPTGEILLYPNTQGSDSLYIYSFQTTNDIPKYSYLLIVMDWYSEDLNPFQCILINTTIQIECTYLKNPSFQISLNIDLIHQHNAQLNQGHTIVVYLHQSIEKNHQYNLQLHLYNRVPSIQKISPSAQMYAISNQSLVYEQNINYGSAIHKPRIDHTLSMNILNSLETSKPGSIVSMKAEFQISRSIDTSLSAFTFVIHHPFKFLEKSIPKLYESQKYSNEPIALYSKPNQYSHQIISPNIFNLVFNESFTTGRRFIVQITEIQNPFYLARSNISVYSLNYNSLTPLQASQNSYPIQTITFPLDLSAGLPYDIEINGACDFFTDQIQYMKVNIKEVPNDIPANYAIKLTYSGGKISKAGNVYANFQSLNYTTIYRNPLSSGNFSDNQLIIKSMGPIEQGRKIQITMMVTQYNTQDFQIRVSIDTEIIIENENTTSFLFDGTILGKSKIQSSFIFKLKDDQLNLDFKAAYNPQVGKKIQIHVQNTAITTSTGAYMDIYMSPFVIFDNDFNGINDCTFNGIANSANCTYLKNENRLIIQPLNSTAANYFQLSSSTVIIYIAKMKFTQTSSNKFVYPFYIRLFSSKTVNAPEFYNAPIILSVLPRIDKLATQFTVHQHGNLLSQALKFPCFVRFQSYKPSQMNYVIQQYQKRILLFLSTEQAVDSGFRWNKTLENQHQIPCASNIDVKCTFLLGESREENLFAVDKVVVQFPSGEQNTQEFHVIVPYTLQSSADCFYYVFIGTYNQLTKDYNFFHQSQRYRNANSWTGSLPEKTTSNIDLQGKAGSYRSNVSMDVFVSSSITTSWTSFIVILTQWSFFEKVSNLSLETYSLSSAIFETGTKSPVSIYYGQKMYITYIPYKRGSSNNFNFWMDNVHMPYTYDLPNMYIYNTRSSDSRSISYNQFQLTNNKVFYESPLKSLSVNCLDNALGVVSTVCTISFSTHQPIQSQSLIRVVLTGLTVATDVCSLNLADGTDIPVTCLSTQDNRNVTLSLSGTSLQVYKSQNYTIIINGIGITTDIISQFFTLYTYDSKARYIIEKGSRILTTTTVNPKVIEIYQILYKYNSPLSYNKMSIKFFVPRSLYSDEQFGFVMGKDLSEVNTEIKRLKIVIIRKDGVQLNFLYQLISSEFKVLFSFTNASQLIESNYTMHIYGISTPASHKNGAFNIIYQRKYDKVYTLINHIDVSFPIFQQYVVSNITFQSFYNTEGYGQQLLITIKNRQASVHDEMQWIINFPSYYSPLLFNYGSYCTIDSTPLECEADPTTPYQLIIKNSPKIVNTGSTYQLRIVDLACPRLLYLNNTYPSRFIFVGILNHPDESFYIQSAQLYPQQTIQSSIEGIIGITNLEVSGSNQNSFSSLFITIILSCNVRITASSYLYLIFPAKFDNFNNQNLNVIIRTINILHTLQAPVINRRIQIAIPSNIEKQVQIKVQFSNLPTPRTQCRVQMSQIISFVTQNNKISLYAASSVSGNSAPQLIFSKPNRYLSFNNDNDITITAGTYSSSINIASSDGQEFINNVNVNVSSDGFIFEPSTIFLKLGDQKGTFRIGADSGLLPVSYFYSAIKQEQFSTSYTITTNNNIKITNKQVQISLPTSIQLPLGGCSQPYLIKLKNNPYSDLSIGYNYDNFQNDENEFWPNPHTTKSQLKFNSTVDNNTLSFCCSDKLSVSQIEITLTLAGTNFNSYAFKPSNKIIYNITPATVVSQPDITIKQVNQQKNFMEFNLTTNIAGIVYYHLKLGSGHQPLTSQQIQVQLKDNFHILQQMKEFLTTFIYVDSRDEKVGQFIWKAGQHSVKFENMLPETQYTLCVYLQNTYNIITDAKCHIFSTRNWGSIMKAKVTFKRELTDVQLNKVLCFFALKINTQVLYLLDVESNSCNDKAVKNLYFNYTGLSYSNQNTSTIIYAITNHNLPSQPSLIIFQNMFESDGSLSQTSLDSALSQFAIDYLQGSYEGQYDAKDMSIRDQADSLVVVFGIPLYSQGKITINNVEIIGGYGSVYFLLVLYKQIHFNQEQETYVNIRLNLDPTQEQVLNCLKYQNLPADGCARAVYSGSKVNIEILNVQENSTYKLYYMASRQFPIRPIVSSIIQQQTVATYTYSLHLLTIFIGLFICQILII